MGNQSTVCDESQKFESTCTVPVVEEMKSQAYSHTSINNEEVPELFGTSKRLNCKPLTVKQWYQFTAKRSLSVTLCTCSLQIQMSLKFKRIPTLRCRTPFKFSLYKNKESWALEVGRADHKCSAPSLWNWFRALVCVWIMFQRPPDRPRQKRGFIQCCAYCSWGVLRSGNCLYKRTSAENAQN